jgi:hypothetical protein
MAGIKTGLGRPRIGEARMIRPARRIKARSRATTVA